MFDGFREGMVDAGGLSLFVRQGGSGPPVLLLHGHPRTSATWHRVAPRLVEQGLTVICADLPGYGRSGKPEPTHDHASHSKRSGAGHLLNAMTEPGYDQFAVVGHDRAATSLACWRVHEGSPGAEGLTCDSAFGDDGMPSQVGSLTASPVRAPTKPIPPIWQRSCVGTVNSELPRAARPLRSPLRRSSGS